MYFGCWQAYRQLALKKHPDKQPNNPNAAAEFHPIQRAFDLLSDGKARAALDDLYKYGALLAWYLCVHMALQEASKQLSLQLVIVMLHCMLSLQARQLSLVHNTDCAAGQKQLARQGKLARVKRDARCEKIWRNGKIPGRLHEMMSNRLATNFG